MTRPEEALLKEFEYHVRTGKGFSKALMDALKVMAKGYEDVEDWYDIDIDTIRDDEWFDAFKKLRERKVCNYSYEIGRPRLRQRCEEEATHMIVSFAGTQDGGPRYVTCDAHVAWAVAEVERWQDENKPGRKPLPIQVDRRLD